MSRKSITFAEGTKQWLKANGLATVKAVLKYPAPPAVALSQSSETFPIQLDNSLAGPPSIYIKRYRYPTIRKQLRQLFHGTLVGRSRSRFEFEFLDNMRKKGLPAVRPIAHGADKRLGFLRACFLIVEGSTGARALDQFAINAPRLTRDQKNLFTQTLANTIRQLHNAGVMHGALAWRNIIVQYDVQCDAKSPPTFHFIDPARKGCILDQPLHPHRAEQDMRHFIASAIAAKQKGGISKFMRVYWGKNRLSESDRTAIRRILKSAAPLVDQERHRLAVTRAWSQVRQNLAPNAQSKKTKPISSAAEFFKNIATKKINAPAFSPGTHVIKIEIENKNKNKNPDPNAQTLKRTLIVKEQVLTTHDNAPHQPNLTIQTDECTWLAILNGDTQITSLIQQGRLRLKGDRALAASLLQTINL